MLRLIFSILLFLFSLLVVVQAPTNFFWKLSIVATEAGIFALLLCLLMLLFPWWNNVPGIISGLLNLLSLILLLLPIVMAYSLNRNLPHDMTKVFGYFETDQKPYSPAASFKFKHPTESYETVVYKRDEEKALSLDFYHAKRMERAPCVIVIHGGSWASGDSRQLPELNAYLSLKGYAVAAINYRLAPEFHSPAPNEDLKAAMEFLRSNAERFNIDTSEFILLGRSAGGQIALLSAYALNDGSIKGVISFYPPADMVWGYYNPGNPLVLDSKKVLNNYAGGETEDEVAWLLQLCSPIEFVTPQSPPTLLIHGSRDVMVAYTHSTNLAEKLEKNKVKHYLLTLPWATHGFDYFPAGPGAQISRSAILQFLRSVTK
jgi:acetyl esterase/lipase